MKLPRDFLTARPEKGALVMAPMNCHDPLRRCVVRDSTGQPPDTILVKRLSNGCDYLVFWSQCTHAKKP